MIQQITDHVQQADKRFVEQYKQSDIKKVTKIYAEMIQDLENVFWDLKQKRLALSSAQGKQLDNFGTIIDQAREGLVDSLYRTLITIKIAQINSDATPEDVIGIFSLFMNADEIIYYESYPASFNLIAVNPNPIGDTSLLSEAIRQAKAPGVGYSLISTPEEYVGFVGDNDALGLGTLTDGSVGGHLSELV